MSAAWARSQTTTCREKSKTQLFVFPRYDLCTVLPYYDRRHKKRKKQNKTKHRPIREKAGARCRKTENDSVRTDIYFLISLSHSGQPQKVVGLGCGSKCLNLRLEKRRRARQGMIVDLLVLDSARLSYFRKVSVGSLKSKSLRNFDAHEICLSAGRSLEGVSENCHIAQSKKLLSQAIGWKKNSREAENPLPP